MQCRYLYEEADIGGDASRFSVAQVRGWTDAKIACKKLVGLVLFCLRFKTYNVLLMSNICGIALGGQLQHVQDNDEKLIKKTADLESVSLPYC